MNAPRWPKERYAEQPNRTGRDRALSLAFSLSLSFYFEGVCNVVGILRAPGEGEHLFDQRGECLLFSVFIYVCVCVYNFKARFGITHSEKSDDHSNVLLSANDDDDDDRDHFVGSIFIGIVVLSVNSIVDCVGSQC